MSASVAPARFLPPGYRAWQRRARAYLHTGVPPEQAAFTGELPLRTGNPQATGVSAPRVPREFLRLSASVACHRDPQRWTLLYRLLWRLTHGEPRLLDVAIDPDVHRAAGLDRAVRRAAHKMKAFVRFRRAPGAAEWYVAWFEPPHRVTERVTPFFVDRFRAMRWSILTPDRCVHWDGEIVTFAPGASAADAPRDDALEELWREYYGSVFNPARVAPGVMRAEMPKSYWKNLPEARIISALTREAPARVTAMIERAAAPAQQLPEELRLFGAGEVPVVRPASPPPLPTRRRSGLDLPSWDALHDPGWEIARARAEALAATSGRAIRCGAVRVLPGVAGWTDPSLLAPGVFYPDHARTPEARLRFYASRFPMVEVDSTYYSAPRREHAVLWAQRTPADFVFNIKAHALMTGHGADVRRLPDWLQRDARHQAKDGLLYGSDVGEAQLDELWARFTAALAPLVEAGKLGAIFLQFPRWFEPGRRAERWLAGCARRLGGLVGAVEFRNPDWATPAVAERAFPLLRELELAYTVVDAPQGTRSSMPPVVRVTRDDFAVLRLHGRRVERWEARNEFVTERYRYLYTREQVGAFVRVCNDMAGRMTGGMLQVSFNNNHANYATTNAAEFGEDFESFQRRPVRD